MSTASKRKSKAILWLISLVVLAVLGFVVLITPNNPLTQQFRGNIQRSDASARIIVGPYPLETDFETLHRDYGVKKIVSLLNPELPYESVLIGREKALAEQYGMSFENYPMSSIFGQRMGANYDTSARKAAQSIESTTDKVYLHCYLGVHRANVVANLVKGQDKSIAKYSVREGERSDEAKLLDKAQAAYDAGKYQQALQILQPIRNPDAATQLLVGWSNYRLQYIPAARSLFQSVLAKDANNVGAHTGLGYCALRENKLPEAEKHLQTVLKSSAQDPAALYGMGLVRYRQNKPQEAKQFLQAALKANPQDAEAKQLLNKLK